MTSPNPYAPPEAQRVDAALSGEERERITRALWLAAAGYMGVWGGTFVLSAGPRYLQWAIMAVGYGMHGWGAWLSRTVRARGARAWWAFAFNFLGLLVPFLLFGLGLLVLLTFKANGASWD